MTISCALLVIVPVLISASTLHGQAYRIKSSGETIQQGAASKPPEPVALPQSAPPASSQTTSFSVPAGGLPTLTPQDIQAITGAMQAEGELITAPPPRPTLSPDQINAIVNQQQRRYLNHEVFGDILKKYVSKSGWVDYRGLKADKEAQDALKSYIDDLSQLNPSSLEDPRDRLAAWLNLYNAVVIRDILKHYPVTTLLKIKDWFGTKRFKIGEIEYSLMEVEEEIFRKELNDSRTVLSRVNGSASAPRMLREPFQAERVDEQLDGQALSFLRNPANVRYDTARKVLTVSQLFMWYEKDFPDLPAFLAAYLDRLPPRFNWAYTGYDYQLNDAKLH